MFFTRARRVPKQMLPTCSNSRLTFSKFAFAIVCSIMESLDAGSVLNLVKLHLLERATLMSFLFKKKILWDLLGLQNLSCKIPSVRNLREKVKNPAVYGVKGPSWISYFPHFDCVQGIAIDYMHGVLLGVQKLLLTLWFSPKHKNRDFSISSKSDRLNYCLENIRPTLDITRLPRPITDMKYWKASEYRSFFCTMEDQ